MSGRWKVACVNWGHPDAPHALVYMLVAGCAVNVRYFSAFPEAIAWAQKVAA